MNLLVALLLAVTLEPEATKVALGPEGWPVAKDETPHTLWWWSHSCAPQKIRGGQPQCGATRELRVRVLDAKGRAVPGAGVTWGTSALLRDVPDAQLPSSTTGEDGSARIAAPASDEIFIRAVTANTASEWTRVASSTREVRLAMKPAVALRVRLRGDDNAPVVRARVALLPPDCTTICSERSLAFDDRKQQAATVTALHGSSVRLVVWSDSHAPMTQMVSATSPELAIALAPAASLDARLVDAERKPVGGAALEVQYRLPGLREGIRRTSIADGGGNVALHGLPRSPVQWTASAPSFARRVDEAALTADPTSLGEIILDAAREVRISVRDETDRPVAGAKVVARGSSIATSDDKGVALLRELPARDTTLTVSREGFLDATATVAKDERTSVVTLMRGAAIKATLVREGGGAPPREVRVRITNNDRETLRTVDTSEGFLLAGLRGGTARLSIEADGAVPWDSGALQLVEGDVTDLGIATLAPGLGIRGTIVNDRGAPLHAARVRLLRTGGDFPALAHILGNWTETTSAEDGTFQLAGLGAGSHFVIVEARGFAQRALPNVTVDAGSAAADLGTIELHPGRTVELTCRPERRCGTEASILLAGAEYPFLSVQTALQQGRGTFTGVPPGHATLRLTKNQHITHERSIDVDPGRQPMTLRIELSSVRVRGDVTVGSGRAREGSLLFTRAVHSAGVPIMVASTTEHGTTVGKTWLGSLGAATTSELTGSGEFVLDEMEPGDYVVVFRGRGASTAPVRVTIPNIPEHRMQLRFDGNEIAGRVLDPAGKPVAARIEVSDSAGASHITSSGMDGQFSLLGLSRGRAKVKATTQRRSAEAEVNVDDESARNVVLRLAEDPDSGLNVEVHDANGNPASGVLVFAIANGGVVAASTDGSGRASLQGIPSGATVPVAAHQLGGAWSFGIGRNGDPTRLVLTPTSGNVIATSTGAAGDVAIAAPNGFPLHRVLPMVGGSARITTTSPLRITGLPPGTYTIVLGMLRKDVPVSAGGAAAVSFE